MKLLGKETTYRSTYSPDLLDPIPRTRGRSNIGIDQLPFTGVDEWRAYEISWLNSKGKPSRATGKFTVPCKSPNIVESKSLKLYLNSFNQTMFNSIDEVIETIRVDLSKTTGAKVDVELFDVNTTPPLSAIQGICLDSLDIEIHQYNIDKNLLQLGKGEVKEVLHTNLFRSNCLVTNQPDWATITLQYEGIKIQHDSLLRYLISYRNHMEFHEQCIERIFTDIKKECGCKKLTLFGLFTRRGGIDINPRRALLS